MNTDLSTVAKKFSQYKGNRLRAKYPQSLWEEAYQLSSNYPKSTIADALGISVAYLYKKFNSLSCQINFTEIEMTPQFSSEKHQLEFTASNGSPMRLQFSGNDQQVKNLVKSLAGIK